MKSVAAALFAILLPVSLAAEAAVQAKPAQPAPIEDRLKKVEARVSEIGAIKFSGDIRLRSESGFGLSNSLPNSENPAVLGNDLSPRHRMRIRARCGRRLISCAKNWACSLLAGARRQSAN